MRRLWFPPCVLLLPLLWLFRKALFAGEMFAFRDSSHYYYPLYKFVHQRWLDGNGIPLWNPFDNLGQPLLADPTAAVMYPGKLLFALPLSYETCFAIYIVAHLWLAGVGLYHCARGYAATHLGALVGALAYELSGQILFQYCNPIFCVGAAWLPWTILAFERTLRVNQNVSRYLILFSITLSLMVYGGDPQLAYHCVLIVGVRCLFAKGQRWHGFRSLMVGCVFALLLSALQVLPGVEWARHSDRAIEQTAAEGQAATIWQRPTSRESHRSRTYDFSVGPWRFNELLFPNVSGHLFPVNSRWIKSLPGEGRMWVPSLYLGLLPVLLAISRLRFVRGSPVVRWLSWIVLLSSLAAMGQYGLCWVANEVRYQLAPNDFQASNVLPGVGGLYWFLTIALPGYASFRYPAKWWTIATFAFALLAAKGWPIVRHKKLTTIMKKCGVLIGASLVITFAVAVALIGFSAAKPNLIFGPLSRNLAIQTIAIAFMHTVVIGFLIARLSHHRRYRNWLWMILLLELCVAQQSMIATLPKRYWSPSQTKSLSNTTIYRSKPVEAYPKPWQIESSTERLAELKRNDAVTLMPKHHMLLGTRSLESSVSMSSADYSMLWAAFRNPEPPLELLSTLGATQVLAPPETHAIPSSSFADEQTKLVRYKNSDAFPRAWVVHDWIGFKPATSNSEAPERTNEIWFDDDGAVRNLRNVVFVESSAQLPTPSKTLQPNSLETVTIDYRSPEHIVVNANVEANAMLVLCDQFFSGWEAVEHRGTEQQRNLDIHRVNRVMRGVFVSKGESQIEFFYRPKSVFWGALISGITCVVMLWTLIRFSATFALPHSS